MYVARSSQLAELTMSIANQQADNWIAQAEVGGDAAAFVLEAIAKRCRREEAFSDYERAQAKEACVVASQWAAAGNISPRYFQQAWNAVRDIQFHLSSRYLTGWGTYGDCLMRFRMAPR